MKKLLKAIGARGSLRLAVVGGAMLGLGLLARSGATVFFALVVLAVAYDLLEKG